MKNYILPFIPVCYDAGSTPSDANCGAGAAPEWSVDDAMGIPIAGTLSKEDAVNLARILNAHDAMVAACRDAIPQLRCLPHAGDPDCPSCQVVARIRAALALATKEPAHAQ